MDSLRRAEPNREPDRHEYGEARGEQPRDASRYVQPPGDNRFNGLSHLRKYTIPRLSCVRLRFSRITSFAENRSFSVSSESI